jgi:hypothetical protein
MRRVNALLDFFSGGQQLLLHPAGKALEVAHQEIVDGPLCHPARRDFLALRGTARAEEGTALDVRNLYIFSYGLGRGEVNALRLVTIAFEVKTQRCFIM